MHTRVFLIGFMGSGKSTLGARLARKTGYRFMDMDQLIEETAGMTIPGIFNEHGEEVFRKWERDILLELCKEERVVVSTGGGAPCHGDLMDLMNEHGETVYIRLSPAALMDRLRHSKTERPLIKGKSESELLKFIETLLEKRQDYYNKARHIVEGIGLDAEHLVEILESE
jgi:shikimate kinase